MLMKVNPLDRLKRARSWQEADKNYAAVITAVWSVVGSWLPIKIPASVLTLRALWLRIPSVGIRHVQNKLVQLWSHQRLKSMCAEKEHGVIKQGQLQTIKQIRGRTNGSTAVHINCEQKAQLNGDSFIRQQISQIYLLENELLWNSEIP